MVILGGGNIVLWISGLGKKTDHPKLSFFRPRRNFVGKSTCFLTSKTRFFRVFSKPVYKNGLFFFQKKIFSKVFIARASFFIKKSRFSIKVVIKNNFTAAIDRRRASGGDRDGHKAVTRCVDRGVKRPIVFLLHEQRTRRN